MLSRPDAPLDDTVAAEHDITVRQLPTLTHGMGMTFADTPLAQAMEAAGVAPGPLPPVMAADEHMRRVGALPLAHQPGRRWSYHVGSDILSVLPARAGQAPLRQILQERITGPLGMGSTGFFGDPAELPTAYQPTDSGLVALEAPDGLFSQPPAFETLGAGLVPTVPDYLPFLTALAEDTLLPAGLRAEMTSDQLTEGQKEGLVGMVAQGNPEVGRYPWRRERPRTEVSRQLNARNAVVLATSAAVCRQWSARTRPPQSGQRPPGSN